MLPTGHVAAGYLTAKALLHFSHQQFTPSQQIELAWWGMFFGFAPDLDVFYYFFKNKTLLVAGQPSDGKSHRKFITHAPVLWAIPGLIVYFFATSPFVRYIGLLFWLGSWSHFILDTVEYGIMWLWPLSDRVYAIKGREEKGFITEQNFFKHSIQFLKFYSTKLSFYLEVAIILVAIYIAIQ